MKEKDRNTEPELNKIEISNLLKNSKSHKNAYNLTNPTSGNLIQKNTVIPYQPSQVTFMKGSVVGCYPKKLL